MREPAGAAFMHRLAKSARKRWCGLTTITQYAGDLLGTELFQSIVAISASKILLRQAPLAIDRVAEAFRLSDGEARSPSSAAHEATASSCIGDDRFPPPGRREAPTEHLSATSDPAELAASA